MGDQSRASTQATARQPAYAPATTIATVIAPSLLPTSNATHAPPPRSRDRARRRKQFSRSREPALSRVGGGREEEQLAIVRPEFERLERLDGAVHEHERVKPRAQAHVRLAAVGPFIPDALAYAT